LPVFLAILCAFSAGLSAQAFDPFRDDPFFRSQTSERLDKQTVLEAVKKKAEESASGLAGSVKAGDLPEPPPLSPAEEAALRGRLAVFPAEADHYWGGLVDVLAECERKLKETGGCGYSLPAWRSMNARTMVREGRLMVPVRHLCYALGAGKEDVVWNPIRKAVEADVRGRKLVLNVGGREMLVDGRRIDLGAPVTLFKDPVCPTGYPVTCVPLRPVAEALGFRVSWDAAAQAALVYPEGAEPLALDQKLRDEIERHRPLNLAPEGFRRMVEAAPEGTPGRGVNGEWYLVLPGGRIDWNPHVGSLLIDRDGVSLAQVGATLHPGATEEAAQRMCDVLARAVPEGGMPRIRELMADAARRMAAGGYVEGTRFERTSERWVMWDYYHYQGRPYWFRLCVMRLEFEQYYPEPERAFRKVPGEQ